MDDDDDHAGVRVRFFKIDKGGDWKDQGTGCLYVKEKDLIVLNEGDTDVPLLSHTVNSAIDYEMQGGTIICWLEPPLEGQESVDCALSFQDEKCCNLTWEWLAQILGGTSCVVDEAGQSRIPIPTLKNLDKLKELLNSSQLNLAEWKSMVEENWIGKLYSVFLICEKSKNYEKCGTIWEIIVIALQSSNNKSFLRNISLEGTRERVLHMAEYNPLLKLTKKKTFWEHDENGSEDEGKEEEDHNYRRLRQKAKSCRLSLPHVSLPVSLGIASKALYDFIYFRDVTLLAVLSDAAMAYFNVQVYYCAFNVVSQVAEDEWLLTNIFKKVNQLSDVCIEESYEDLCFLIGFLRELVLFHLKSIQLPKRQELMKKVYARGLLECFFDCIKNKDVTPDKHPVLWNFVVESLSVIFSTLGVHMMCNFIVVQETAKKKGDLKYPLFQRLIDCLFVECDSALTVKILYLISLLLVSQRAVGVENFSAFSNVSVQIKQRVWTVFHNHYISQIMKTLDETNYIDPEHTRLIQMFVIDILKECVTKHGFCMKQSILNHNIIHRVMNLIIIPNKKNYPIENTEVTLACLRFCRSCVQPNEFFISQLIQKNAFSKIMDLYQINVYANNMINSTIFSIFDKLLQPNTIAGFKKLIIDTGRKYLDLLMEIDPEIFQPLQDQYENLSNSPTNFINHDENSTETKDMEIIPEIPKKKSNLSARKRRHNGKDQSAKKSKKL